MSGAGRPRDEFERELFAELTFLLRFAKKLTQNAERGEDLYSEVLVKLLANKRSYVLGSNMRAWAAFIMRNAWRSDRRSAWRSEEWNDDFDRTLVALENPLAELEFKEVIDSMKYLPKETSEAVMMIAEGLSYEEAATESGIEVGTIKSRVSRGRKMLGKLLG